MSLCGQILNSRKSQRVPSYIFKKTGVSAMYNWCTLVKIRLESFGGTGAVKPYFHQLENLSNFVIWLKIFARRSVSLFEKAFIYFF